MSKSSEEKAIDKLIAQDSAVFYDNSESLENYGDTKLEIETDSIMIMSDVHAPYYHAGMMAKAIEVARKKKIKTLLLNGDFMDCGTWSSHGGVDSQDWDEELESATNLLEIFRQVFEECYWIKGNHENRFSRQTEFKGQMRHLALQVGVSYDDPWCTVSENDSITINEKWRFVHPSRHYSIIPGKTAKELYAVDGEHHIIVGHEHHAVLSLSPDGRHIIGNVAALVDSDKVAYKHRQTTKHPAWSVGFATIIKYPDAEHGRIKQYVNCDFIDHT